MTESVGSKVKNAFVIVGYFIVFVILIPGAIGLVWFWGFRRNPVPTMVFLTLDTAALASAIAWNHRHPAPVGLTVARIIWLVAGFLLLGALIALFIFQ